MTLNTTEKNALRLIMQGDVDQVSRSTLRRLRERGLLTGKRNLTWEGLTLAAPEVGAQMKKARDLEVGDRVYIPDYMNVDGIVPTVTVVSVEVKAKTVWIELRIMAMGQWIIEKSRPKHEDAYPIMVGAVKDVDEPVNWPDEVEAALARRYA